MGFSFKELVEYFQEQWFETSGLIWALLVCVTFSSSLLAIAQTDLLTSVLIVAVICSAVFGFWRLSKRVPTTTKGKLGVVVSIGCEETDQRKRVREDFTIPLKQKLSNSPSGSIFEFIEYPDHISRKLNTASDALKLRMRSRAHFMIFGRARQRVLDGVVTHVIELDGAVAHAEIKNEALKNQFAREFSELFPRRIQFSEENDLLKFQFTSEWASAVVQYIIGIAATVSGDFDFAEECYRETTRAIEVADPSNPIYAKLNDRLPIRISELYEVRAVLEHKAWVETQDPSHITRIRTNLDQVIDTRKNDPRYLNLSAVHLFLSNRETDAAIRELKKIKSASDGTGSADLVSLWNCNMGFLYAYKGEMKHAIRHYRTASRIGIDPDVLYQVENFLVWLIQNEPQNYQLLMALAFFNWKIKGDSISAVEDFKTFLASRADGTYEKEAKLCIDWIEEIEGKQES